MGQPAKTWAQFVSDMVSAWGAQLNITPNFQSGDVLLAAFQAVAGQNVFLQAQAQLANALARAQTSNGPDLDSFMAQYGFTRLPATFADGPETLSAPQAAPAQVLVFPGVVVQTVGGAIQYQVVADSTQAAWNATLGAYVLAQGDTSITVTVQALVAGPTSNVIAGQLSQLATPVPGITVASNAAPITNGLPAESDNNFRARFVLWVNSLSKATQNAILAAVAGVQQGISINLLENKNPSNQTVLGQFTAVVDDGSGDPPDSLLAAISAAVQAVRGFTIQANVIAPNIVVPPIVLNINIAAGYVTDTVKLAVQNAVVAAVNTIGIGNTLFVSFIEQAALTVSGVLSVQAGATTINGLAADYAVTAIEEVKITLTNVTVGTYT